MNAELTVNEQYVNEMLEERLNDLTNYIKLKAFLKLSLNGYGLYVLYSYCIKPGL